MPVIDGLSSVRHDLGEGKADATTLVRALRCGSRMNLSFYRFFFITDGRTIAAEVLQCDGDGAAIEKAKQLLATSCHAQMVVWEGSD